MTSYKWSTDHRWNRKLRSKVETPGPVRYGVLMFISSFGSPRWLWNLRSGWLSSLDLAGVASTCGDLITKESTAVHYWLLMIVLTVNCVALNIRHNVANSSSFINLPSKLRAMRVRVHTQEKPKYAHDVASCSSNARVVPGQ